MSLTINLRNISWKPGKPAPAKADYHYEVFVNSRCIESGFVRGHDRSDGWDGLLLLLGSERETTERYDPPALLPPLVQKPTRK